MRRKWKWKKEALNCTVWRTHFRRHYEPVRTQTASSSSPSSSSSPPPPPPSSSSWNLYYCNNFMAYAS